MATSKKSPMGASASASVNMELRPMHSQVVLAVIAVGGILSMVAGWQLLSSGNSFGLLFFGLAVIIVGAVLICWERSRGDIDLADSQPTKVIAPDGSSVVTDTRLLTSAEGSRIVGMLFTAIGERVPLPPPQGKVADDGTVIVASEAQAQDEARLINAEAEAATLALGSNIREAFQGASSVQRVDDVLEMPPANPGPDSTSSNLNSVARR